MGSWRRVGAFLGLVPDDQHPYDADGYDAGPYDDGYESPRDRGSYAGSATRDGREAPGAKAYPESGYTRSKVDTHAADGYHPSGEENLTSAAPHGGRGGSTRRPFGSEPVTQGALAMKAEQRRDTDTSTASRPASVKLTGFGEARIVGEKYRDGQSVILDMTGMSDADARRLVDFSAGLAFSLRGSIEKVAPKVFMLLPAEADIAGGAAHALEDARAYVGGYAGR
ncbi:cell division inhibitor SepF [Nakamurella sp. UYEF19]|uniref:cell division protein SepF n=1 Tax=Nakamurella sp. UYEF19 TaxID=1756392 RepID=UPI003393751E